MDHWKDDMEKPLKDSLPRSGRRRRKMRERNGPLKGWYSLKDSATFGDDGERWRGKAFPYGKKTRCHAQGDDGERWERGMDHWKDDMEKSLKDSLPRSWRRRRKMRERNGPLKGWYGKVSKRLAATLRETTAKDEREEWTIERMIWKSL